MELRITEVEAYRWPDDSASHGRAGRTARNASMWGPPGRAYVFLCYGLHRMLNVVCGPEGEAAAVLIRACEALAGLETIRRRRGGRRGPELLVGPGRVGQALDLGMEQDGASFAGPDLLLLDGPAPEAILQGPRIGIDYADPEHVAAPWRLAIADSDHVARRGELSAAARRPEIGEPEALSGRSRKRTADRGK